MSNLTSTIKSIKDIMALSAKRQAKKRGLVFGTSLSWWHKKLQQTKPINIKEFGS